MLLLCYSMRKFKLQDTTCVCVLTKFYIYVHFHLKDPQLDVHFSSQIQSSTAMYTKWVNIQSTIQWTMQGIPGVFLGSISCRKYND